MLLSVPCDSGAWDVVPAPRDAVPDAPACSSELVCWPARSSSLPRDRIAQNCTVRLAANSPSIRRSLRQSDSAAWNGGAEGGQVLSHPSRMILEQSHMPAVFNRAQHHPDNMPHAATATLSTADETIGTPQRCRSRGRVALSNPNSVPPSECWDYLAER